MSTDRNALATALCHEYHPMHWDVAYGNRNRPCGACRIHAAHLLAAGCESPGAYERDTGRREGAVHCATCVCGCTCGFGGQHDDTNPRCELNADRLEGS